MVDALKRVDVAKEHLQGDDFEAAAVFARKAAENMLVLVAAHRGIRRPESPNEKGLDWFVHTLSKSGDLPPRVATHVVHVQRLGNHAVHALPAEESLSEEVEEGDAKGAILALDQVARWFRESMPAELVPPSAPTRPPARTAPAAPPPYVPPPVAQVRPAAPPPVAQARPAAPSPAPGKARRKPADPGGRSWLQNAGLGLLALAAPAVGFVVMVQVLGWFGPAGRAVSDPSVAAPAPALDADLGADPTAPVLSATAAADAADVVRKQISADLDLSPDSLTGLGCSELARSRNWLWVRHGYVLKDPAERVVLGSLAHGVRPAATAREIHREFTPHDAVNQALLEQALRSAGCPCPTALRPDRPCPE